ncbi:hypothetical protein P154DRAFT_533042 [Amniculicola lignicola CBS 123094]|uniref:DUF7907 domain-containing protein n=1 Tax=Amniculicola lignicola CBS 123094 TaxID=1392246 RepID=A0A6A5WKM4_9PLEO|nr:hypothetical protein P154DRAFT_533042 [Amniculicola lignicola CBS 123094]
MILSEGNPIVEGLPINGTVLGACHEGAATKGLCLTGMDSSSPESYTTFYHNTTESADPAMDPYGILGYDFKINLDEIHPSTLSLSKSDTSNVAIPIIQIGDRTSTYVSFSDCGTLYIHNSYDDTVIPGQGDDAKVENWQICQTYFAYRFWTLAWVIGLKDPKPQNPTCVPVRVVRLFV